MYILNFVAGNGVLELRIYSVQLGYYWSLSWNANLSGQAWPVLNCATPVFDTFFFYASLCWLVWQLSRQTKVLVVFRDKQGLILWVKLLIYNDKMCDPGPPFPLNTLPALNEITLANGVVRSTGFLCAWDMMHIAAWLVMEWKLLNIYSHKTLIFCHSFKPPSPYGFFL